MAQETTITVIGRVAGDVDMRFTPSGTAVANFSVASNARFYDKQTNEWKDKATTFWRCNAWKELAEACTENLHKGDAVILYGELESREWEDKEGNKRTSLELRVEAIGPNLRWTRPRQQSQPAQYGQQDTSGGDWDAGPAF